MNTQAQTFTEEEILLTLSRPDPRVDDVLRYLYRTYFGSLSLYVLQNNGSRADAEDIFQEVIIAFMNLVRTGKYRGEAGIKTLLYALNRNLWLNELKRRGRMQAREEYYGSGAPDSAPGIQQAMEYRQTTKALLQTVEQLGETCKKILLLFYYENRSMKEILSVLPYENEQVVRNRKSKCLKKMEQLVQQNTPLYQQLKTFLYG